MLGFFVFLEKQLALRLLSFQALGSRDYVGFGVLG